MHAQHFSVFKPDAVLRGGSLWLKSSPQPVYVDGAYSEGNRDLRTNFRMPTK